MIFLFIIIFYVIVYVKFIVVSFNSYNFGGKWYFLNWKLISGIDY